MFIILLLGLVVFVWLALGYVGTAILLGGKVSDDYDRIDKIFGFFSLFGGLGIFVIMLPIACMEKFRHKPIWDWPIKKTQ